MDGIDRSDVSRRKSKASSSAGDVNATTRLALPSPDLSAAAHDEDEFDRVLRLLAQVAEPPQRCSASEQLPVAGDIVGGEYRIDRLIGRGGMGAVFAAVHVASRKRFALKWVLPNIAHEFEIQERFKRECRAGLAIRHPNVVRVFHLGDHRGVPFLVMELLEGISLQSRMATGPFSLEQTLATFIPIVGAVAAVHRHGVLHRDLKPDNVILVRTTSGLEIPKILDFGLSKPMRNEPDLATITRRDIVLGTPAFTAPEQLLGEAVDARADIYSLGVLLYTMLAGRRPFEAKNYNQFLFKIATERPVPLSTLRPALPRVFDRIVSRCMARVQSERFASADQLADALTPLAAATGTGAATRAAS